jgi:hypothetical protein
MVINKQIVMNNTRCHKQIVRYNTGERVDRVGTVQPNSASVQKTTGNRALRPNNNT